MKTKLLAVSYFLFLALVVYFADSRAHLHWFTYLRSIPGGDKYGHFLLMGSLAFLVNLSLSCRVVSIAGRRFLLGSLLVLVLITIEEFSQRFVPYRTFDLTDLLADYLGVFVFSWLAVVIQRKKRAVQESRG
jgi:VanZ family protein